MIPSPKVPNYADKPEMSAYLITEKLIKELNKHTRPDFIALNYANCDLVGHSGSFKAAKKAAETLDKCLADLIPVALEKGYTVLLTADHGNAEQMKYKNGEICPAHTLNPVIFMCISDQIKTLRTKRIKEKGLKNIAPTVLKILGVRKPRAMKGKSLV